VVDAGGVDALPTDRHGVDAGRVDANALTPGVTPPWFDPAVEITHEDVALALSRPIAPTAITLLAQLRRVGHMLVLDLDRSVDGLGVSYAQVEVMELLDARPTIHGGEIARTLRVTRQAAHRLLRQLERGDLAEREPSDGFARPATLTRDGAKRLDMARTALGGIRDTIDRLEPEDRIALQKGLRALEDVLVTRVERWW
jgi:DNA-binding MarR family transcriptional regulator